MPVLEFFRQYTLREYTAVLAVALMGAAGVVFMLNAAGGGPASKETLALKRETTQAAPVGSVVSVEAEAQAEARRAKAHTRILAERRRIRAMRTERAARRAASARSKAASHLTVVRTTPRSTVNAPVRVVNTAPAPQRQSRPSPSPTPKKSGVVGGGGRGNFDDSG